MTHFPANTFDLCQTFTKEDRYFEDKQYPESKNTENSGKTFQVNTASSNTRDNFPKKITLKRCTSDNQTDGSIKIENTQRENLGNELTTPVKNEPSSYNPQSSQLHKGNTINLDLTLPHPIAAMNAHALYQIVDYHAPIIQPVYLGHCYPFWYSNGMLIPHYYYLLNQPHYHYILSQPLFAVQPISQSILSNNCRPVLVNCHNLCNDQQSGRVPAKANLKTDSLTQSNHNNILDSKKGFYERHLISNSYTEKLKDKNCGKGIVINANSEIPHMSYNINSLPSPKSNIPERIDYNKSQCSQEWKRCSNKMVEQRLPEREVTISSINNLENYNEEIPNIKYLNSHFFNTDSAVVKNWTTPKDQIKCDNMGCHKQFRKTSHSRVTNEFQKENQFPNHTHNVEGKNKTPTEQLVEYQCSKDSKISCTFLTHQLPTELQGNSHSEIKNKTTINHKNGHSENLMNQSMNETNNVTNFMESRLNFSQNDAMNNYDEKRCHGLEKAKYVKSNLDSKLLGKRPVIFQNGIQEMNITINEDKGEKEGSNRKYNSNQLNRICCPIRKKANNNEEVRGDLKESGEENQNEDILNSCQAISLKKTKAIINLVLQQLQENKSDFEHRVNETQNPHFSGNMFNVHQSSRKTQHENTKDRDEHKVDNVNMWKSYISSMISQMIVTNQTKEECSNETVMNQQSLPHCSSTPSNNSDLIDSDVRFLPKDLDSESGIDTE